MANPIPARRDASSWYECVNCSYQIDVESVGPTPTCPNCDGPAAVCGSLITTITLRTTTRTTSSVSDPLRRTV